MADTTGKIIRQRCFKNVLKKLLVISITKRNVGLQKAIKDLLCSQFSRSLTHLSFEKRSFYILKSLFHEIDWKVKYYMDMHILKSKFVKKHMIVSCHKLVVILQGSKQDKQRFDASIITKINSPRCNWIDKPNLN